MSVSTDLPIHEVILKIMYFEDREKPIELSPADILWKIDNPEITERYVREVLNWLVREKKVKSYLDKYSLDRHEFLEQKAKYPKDLDIDEESATFYIEQEPKKFELKGWKSKGVFLIGGIILLIMTYLFMQLRRDYQLSTKLEPEITIQERQPEIKKMYMSNGEGVRADEKFKGISYSFLMQNNNNKAVSDEIKYLYTTIDSLQKSHQTRLNLLQQKIDKNINNTITHTNTILNRIMVCNILFLGIITVLFFRKKG